MAFARDAEDKWIQQAKLKYPDDGNDSFGNSVAIYKIPLWSERGGPIMLRRMSPTAEQRIFSSETYWRARGFVKPSTWMTSATEMIWEIRGRGRSSLLLPTVP